MEKFNTTNIVAGLKKDHIYLTKNRLQVLELLSEQETAVSVGDIVKCSGGRLDRISVYRALNFYLKKGLVHIVPNIKGDARYILIKNHTANNASPLSAGKSQLVYFMCISCGSTALMDNFPVPSFHFPSNFHIHNCHLLIEGWCKGCSH
jgi:Fur family transcriptional regulator, ferric uptake regulator